MNRIARYCLTAVVGWFAIASVHAAEPVVIGDPGSSDPPRPLHAPFAVAFDEAGSMWVVEYDGGRILQQVNQDFVVRAGDSADGYVDGAAADARFNRMHNLVFGPSGRILVSDHKNHAVRFFDRTTGEVGTLIGGPPAGFDGDSSQGAGEDGGTDEDGGIIRLNQAISIALTHDRSGLLIADIKNLRVRRYDFESGTIRTVAGNGRRGVPVDGETALDQPLMDPRAVTATTDGFYIAERNGNALRLVRDGRIFTVAGTGEKGSRDGVALRATFNGPKHIERGPDGRVYIADDLNHKIRIYDPSRRSVSTLDTTPLTLNRPHGVTHYRGDLFIADSFNHRIIKIQTPSP